MLCFVHPWFSRSLSYIVRLFIWDLSIFFKLDAYCYKCNGWYYFCCISLIWVHCFHFCFTNVKIYPLVFFYDPQFDSMFHFFVYTIHLVVTILELLRKEKSLLWPMTWRVTVPLAGHLMRVDGGDGGLEEDPQESQEAGGGWVWLGSYSLFSVEPHLLRSQARLDTVSGLASFLPVTLTHDFAI